MNYWIFVHTGENADKTFEHLIGLKNWGFQATKPIKNKVMTLQRGDVIIFYVGGSNGGYLNGEASLVSNVHAPARDSIGGSKDAKLDAMVDFDNVDQWGNKRLYVTERSIREKLNFIKNKDNWGMTFGQSIIRISESDYLSIKNML